MYRYPHTPHAHVTPFTHSHHITSQVAVLQVGPEFNSHFENLYKYFVTQLRTVLPPGTDFSAAYTAGTDEDQALVQNLALFFTGFFRVSS